MQAESQLKYTSKTPCDILTQALTAKKRFDGTPDSQLSQIVEQQINEAKIYPSHMDDLVNELNGHVPLEVPLKRLEDNFQEK